MSITFYVILSFLWWQVLSITVISSGYHRYFAHRAFKAPVWYEYYVLTLGILSGGGPLLGWAGVHRLHHRYSDTNKDPHSPTYISIWRVLTSTFKVPPIKRASVKDLLKNPRVMWFYKNHNIFIIGYTILFMLIAYYTSLPIAIVLLLSPLFYSYLGFGLINAFGHDKNGPKNSQLLNIFSGGDGFHKNHHEAPKDWQIGKKWYEFDPGALFIRLIKIDE